MPDPHAASLSLTARLGRIISDHHPVIPFSSEDICLARQAYSADDLREMHRLGLLPQDFETYYVVREFLYRTGVDVAADGDYLLALFSQARRLDAAAWESDPYLAHLTVPDVSSGDVRLTTASYEKGEIFLYDMPDLTSDVVVPKLGYFGRKTSFPALYQGSMPWISVCPSEVNSMRAQIDAAHGRVLVLGLGLGYYPFMISARPQVQAITVVELNPTIIDLFRTHLLPQFPYKEKIHVVQGDALAYVESLPDGRFDFCFADIWESVTDGAIPYARIKAQETRLRSMQFTYWIEDQIKAFLQENQ